MVKVAINHKAAVSAYSNLPIASNSLGDVRTARDTGIQYYWTINAASGALTDWKILNDCIPSTINNAEKINLELETEFKAASLTRYKELTYAGGDLTRIDIYTSPAKTVQLFSKIFTYVGSDITQSILTRISDGITLTKDFGYTGSDLTSVTIS